MVYFHGKYRFKGPAKETQPGLETRAKRLQRLVKETHFGPDQLSMKPINPEQKNQPVPEHEIQPISELVPAQRLKSDQFPSWKSSLWKNPAS